MTTPHRHIHTRSAVALVIAGLTATSMSISAPSASAAVMCGGKVATIVGTAGNDRLIGTAGPDVIVGIGGNDTIVAKGGDDMICPFSIDGGTFTIDGGPGKDTLNFRNITRNIDVEVDLLAGTFSTRSTANSRGTLISVENLRSVYARIVGSRGPNKVDLDYGFVEPMGGNDTISSPFPDADLHVSYARAGGPVHVNVAAGTTSGWTNDKLSHVYFIVGTPYAENLTTGTTPNHAVYIEGGGGADVMIGGDNYDNLIATGSGASILGGGSRDDIYVNGGWAIIDGGRGNDVLWLTSFAEAVTVDLGRQTVITGSATRALTSIESVHGTRFNDTLIGSNVYNLLDGFAGNDIVRGLGGDDILWGWSGTDTLDGGDGNDVCIDLLVSTTQASCESFRDQGNVD